VWCSNYSTFLEYPINVFFVSSNYYYYY
jgi:hypothetical protein